MAASLLNIAAIFTQKEGTEHIVTACYSKTLSKSQRSYSATKRKVSPIVHFTQQFKNFFLFHSSYYNRSQIYYFKEPYGMVARWVEKIGQLFFDVKP